MCYLKSLFSVVTLLIVANIGYGQPEYPFSLIPQTTPSNIQLTNYGAPNTWGYFYLTGDGFFQTANLAIRKYAGLAPYTATCFELRPYDGDPPKKASLTANYPSSINSFATIVNMPFNTGVSVSWSPSQRSYNYFIFKSKRVPNGKEQSTCAEFHYNDAIVDLDMTIGGPILNNFPNVKWINSVSAPSSSSFPGFNKKIICTFDSLMLDNDTSFVYIPMKSKVPAPSTIKIGTKLCHESTLRQDVFQVAGTPYDPNAIEAYEQCFYHWATLPVNLNTLPGHKINYKVRFQNKGVGPAINVRVEIPLDPKIDPNSISIIDSEFPCTFSVSNNFGQPGHTMTIYFNNINLPGIAQTNPTITYEESESWVNFVLCTKQMSDILNNCPLDASCCINHQAKIYFDNQQPVLTSTATTCIVCTSPEEKRVNAEKCETRQVDSRTKNETGKVVIIPNPAHENIQLSLNKPVRDAQVQIFDQAGRLISDQRYTYIDQHTNIDIKNLNTGSYTIKLTSAEEFMVLRFIKQ